MSHSCSATRRAEADFNTATVTYFHETELAAIELVRNTHCLENFYRLAYKYDLQTRSSYDNLFSMCVNLFLQFIQVTLLHRCTEGTHYVLDMQNHIVEYLKSGKGFPLPDVFERFVIYPHITEDKRRGLMITMEYDSSKISFEGQIRFIPLYSEEEEFNLDSYFAL